MLNERKKIIAFLTFYIILTLFPVWADDDTKKEFYGTMHVEIGIDSLEQRYYKPDFRFDFPLSFANLFTQFYYYQVMDGSLRGRIDYWIILGLQKEFNQNLKFEARINHMCRHTTSYEHRDVFNFNEVIGRVWLLDKHYKLGFAAGTYTGGSADYKSLLQLNGELPRIFGSELSLRGEIKLVDFKEVLHEAELFFSLGKSTDLFIRNSRHYELKNNTYIGMRMKSAGRMEKYMESFFISTDIYPDYEDHKISVEGNFKLAFFKNNNRKVIVSTDFIAPVIRGESFLGNFYPDKMVYLISMQYLLKINESLYAAWFNRYSLDMPVDKSERFSASLATGVALKNQVDFHRIEKKIRFDVFSGYNFKHSFELDIKLGASLIKREGFNISSDFRFNINKDKLFADIRLFFDYGRSVTFRPFIGLEKVKYFNPRQPVINKFSFGFAFFRWLN